MEPDSAEQLAFSWCEQHGWEQPQFVNGKCWAIAPNCFVPEPIPSSSPALTININLAEVEAAFERFSETTRTALQNQDRRYTAILDFRESYKRDRDTLGISS